MSETGFMSTAGAPNSRQSTAAILVAGVRSADVWRGIESDSRLKHLNLRFYRFTCEAGSFFLSTLKLDDVAASLYRFILEVSREEGDLVLVGHSFGGIILQRLLTGPDYHLLDRIRLVVLIATPVSNRKMSSRLFDFGSRRLILPDYLDSLNAEWNVLVKQRGVPVVSVVGLRDYMAPYDAGRHWDARNLIVADQDHIGLAHDTDILSTVLYNRLSERSDSAGS